MTEALRQNLSYDPETGVFRWALPRSRVRVGQIAGYSTRDGYKGIEFNGKSYLQHRLAWMYVYGEEIDGEIDHINGDRADNRIANLRVVTRAQNCQNRHNVRSDSKTGVLGASFNEGTFRAEIVVYGVRKFLGRFKTAEEAGRAYLAAKAELSMKPEMVNG